MRLDTHALVPMALRLFVLWLMYIGTAAPLFASDAVALPRDAIGKVTYAGFSSRTQCTGTLIAPDMVLTAAHCLKTHDTGKPLPPSELHFLAGYNKGAYLAHARGKTVTFLPETSGTSEAARLLSDAAIIVLDRALTLPLPLLSDTRGGPPDTVIHAGYMQHRPEVLTRDNACPVSALPSGLWASTCHVEPGSSGGPVFAMTSDGPRLDGIVTAVNDTGISIIIPLTAMRDLLPAKSGSTRP